MDTLEALRAEAYAAGLAGKPVPRQLWLDTSDFGRAYQESWLAGALAATAPPATEAPAPATIVARAW